MDFLFIVGVVEWGVVFEKVSWGLLGRFLLPDKSDNGTFNKKHTKSYYKIKYINKSEESMGEQLNLFTNIIDETENESIKFRYDITSYGADYPVDGLIKRLKRETLKVPPFQRKYIWNINEASKFIESLLLGLPVPGIFLYKEEDSKDLLIIDGQQRLLTLLYFYNEVFEEKKFRLINVQKDMEGKCFSDLSPSDRNRLDDSIIHATIIKQDEPDDDESSVYQIFERINSGGRELSPQEIRSCIYYGEYNKLLHELTQSADWRSIVHGKHNLRLKEEELILRFFSLYFHSNLYHKPMKDFLNKSMSKNRNFEFRKREEFKEIFDKTISFINRVLGKKAFREQRGIHSAIYDSVMIGTAFRLEKGEIYDIQNYIDVYDELIKNKKFNQLIKSGTSDERNVKERIRMAVEKIDKVV